MTTYHEPIRIRVPVRSQYSVRLLGCLLLCLSGLRATGVAQTSIGPGTITTFAGSQGNSSDFASTRAADLATQTGVGYPAAIVTDSSGNVYFTDNSGPSVVWVVYQASTPLLAAVFPGQTLTAGYAYAVVNANGEPCAQTTCGDGGLATGGALSDPTGLAFDAAGDLYIADGVDNAIRKVDATTGLISTIAGDPMHTNFGYSGENVLALGTLLFGPTSVAFDGLDNLYVSDANNNIIRKIDHTTHMITTVAGTVPIGTNPGTPVGCTAAPCGGENVAATSATLDYVYNIFVDAAGDIYASDSNAAAIRRIDASTQTIATVAGTLSAAASSSAGEFPVTCAPPTPATPTSCGDGGAATSALLNNPTGSYLDAQGNLYIVDQNDNAVRMVDTGGIIHTVVAQLSASGSYGGDGSAADNAMLNTPFGLTFNSNGVLYIADGGNNVVRKVVPAAPLPAQTLTFTPPANATYGSSIDLSSDATSTDPTTHAPTGLTATFSVTSGPATISGSTLTITGVGSVVVKASQAGNASYAPASASATIAAMPATLMVIASQNASLDQGAPIPATFPYTITGFVSPDTQQSVVTGAPSMQVKNAAGTVLPPGSIPANGNYTIVIGAASGFTAGANYQFSFTNGMLLVTAGETQTVSFGAYTPPTVYGGANSTFTFSATSSVAGLPVAVSATPTLIARLQQLSTTMWSVTVVGAGQVTLTASQAGNTSYSPASITAQFVVGPAVLTIPLNNAISQYGATPSFTYAAPTGFIGADNSAVLSGAPAYVTTATATSDPGAYPLTATAGTLFAQNYTFSFVPATLTIVPATQQILAFTTPTNVLYQQDYPLQAAASSGLPVVYSATGAVQIDSSGVGFQATGVGAATITATQAGNIDYAPVSATLSFSVPPFSEYITAVPVSAAFGDPIPPLNWCFAVLDPNTGLAACSTNVSVAANLYSGAPALTTTAAPGSPTGVYPITAAAGTLTSSTYSFVFEPGVLTITPASTYTLTANPASITIPRGQSRQATITLTPVNNFIGTVTLACSGLPAGVTCTVSPSSLTTSVNYQGIANPVSGTLTISAGEVVGRNATGDKNNLPVVAMLGVPGMFAGILIFYRRRQFKRHSIFTGILLLVALAASITFVSACGGGGSHSGGAHPRHDSDHDHRYRHIERRHRSSICRTHSNYPVGKLIPARKGST